MLPKFDANEWLSMVATAEADSVHTATSTFSAQYSQKSTAAMPASTYTGAGGWLSYAAFDEVKNIIKLLYSGNT